MRGNILVELNEKPLLSIDFKEETVIEMDVKDTSLFDLIEVYTATAAAAIQIKVFGIYYIMHVILRRPLKRNS